MRVLALLCAMLVASAASVSAQRYEDLPERTLRQIQQNPDQARPQLVRQFFDIAPDGQLTQEILDLKMARELASRRARVLGENLAYDLNGDLEISHDEVARFRMALQGGQRANFEEFLIAADADQDGAITTQELLDLSEIGLREQIASRQPTYMMAFDVNGDGTVVLDEIMATIDGAHILAINEGLVARIEPPTVCRLPEVSEDAELVFLTGHSAASLSDVAVSGRDAVTQGATITIEDGEAPIYLVIWTHSGIIWQFEGAVERVQRVVAYGRVGVGISGLSPEVVTLDINPDCFPRHASDAQSSRGFEARGKLATLLGREPDIYVANYSFGVVSLPSGEMDEATLGSGDVDIVVVSGGRRFAVSEEGVVDLSEEDADPENRSTGGTLSAFKRFYPLGLMNFDADTVLSNRQVLAYDVLPQQAGLLQLLAEGRLEVVGGGRELRITQPIERFPAGLNGAHSVKFILGTDVPIPAGSPGHSQVKSEETGECLTRGGCR